MTTQIDAVGFARASTENEAIIGSDGRLRATALREMCLALGADDVGFVSIDRAEIAPERDGILEAFPATRSLIAFVARMRRDNIRSPLRSLANLEFHAVNDQVTETSQRIVDTLTDAGARAVHTAMGFPMEASRWPGKIWVLSHKVVAEAAGLGKMGIHRNVIHPKLGSFVFLGTVLVDREIDEESRPLDFNSCLTCKLCVAACPVGAISPEGDFNFSSCYTHNYREFMGGFVDWVESVAGAKDAPSYRARVRDDETVSMWQSLAYGPNYKAAYCVAVCPAGEDVIAPFRDDRGAFVEEIVRPLQRKEETVYVLPNSDAERHVRKRFPHKLARVVSNGTRPATVRGFLDALPHFFQSAAAEGLDARYHFTFTGDERATATVEIQSGRLRVLDGHVGAPDLRVRADARAWLRFLRREVSIVRLLLARRVRLRGAARLLVAFGRCFPV